MAWWEKLIIVASKSEDLDRPRSCPINPKMLTLALMIWAVSGGGALNSGKS